MCFVNCKKPKKLTSEEKRQRKIDSQKAMVKIYSEIVSKRLKYLGSR